MKKIMTIILLLALLITPAALPGCGGSGGTESLPGVSVPANDPAGDPGGSFSSADPASTITIRGMIFSTDETEIHLMGYDLTDEEIAPLKNMTNLKGLDLCYNLLTDARIFTDMKSLEWLCLIENERTNMHLLKSMKWLEELGLTPIDMDQAQRDAFGAEMPNTDIYWQVRRLPDSERY